MPILGIVNASKSNFRGVAGYFAGGNTGSAGLASTEKLTFSTDGIAALANPLTVNRHSAAGFANSGVAGYVAGGYLVASINKITFPADTVGSLSDTLTSARYSPTGFANSGVAGYAAGGDDGTATQLNGIDKITFPADTKTTLSALMTQRGDARAGFANNGVAGYLAGGEILTAPARIATIDKITFPADTLALLSSPIILTAAISFLSGFANSGVAGYAAGGSIGGSNPYVTTIDKLTFPSDTKSSLSPGLTVASYFTCGMANSGVAGYISRGSGTGGPNTVVEKVTFPTDTVTVVTAQLTVARYAAAGFADSGTL